MYFCYKSKGVSILESCKAKYKDSQQLFERKDATLFLTHFGELNSEKITDLSSKTEEHLIQIGATKRTVRNIFNILIEGLQNIINHGETSPNGEQLSFFNVGELENHFIVTFSNLISNDKTSNVIDSIQKLNNADQAGVKEIYLKTLTNGEISEKGGAGLGIITMAMKSKNTIDHQLTKINDKLSLITIETKIDKK